MFASTELRRRGAEGHNVDGPGAAQDYASDKASAPNHRPDDISTHLDVGRKTVRNCYEVGKKRLADVRVTAAVVALAGETCQ